MVSKQPLIIYFPITIAMYVQVQHVREIQRRRRQRLVGERGGRMDAARDMEAPLVDNNMVTTQLLIIKKLVTFDIVPCFDFFLHVLLYLAVGFDFDLNH